MLLQHATIPSPELSPVDALRQALGDDIQALDNTVLACMESPVPLINQLAAYIIAAGGKRLRPLLTLAIARLVGYQGAHHLKLGAAVEFIHTATLLHDDVVDESTLRRGQAAANEIFGNQASVLVGDFLFSRAFQLMVDTDCPHVLRILADASAVIAQGEVMQLVFTGNLDLTRKQYFEVISAKTAALFGAACEVGAEIAQAQAAYSDAAKRFGHHLGVAFQITDDVLDYKGQTTSLGKNVGDDFKEGKLTLPVVIALEYAPDYERDFWRRTMVDLEQKEGDFDYAQNLLRQHNALETSMQLAQEEIDKAIMALASLPPHPLNDLLAKTARYAIARKK
jgi:octaprenyl-diphosphate synthase